MRTVYLIIFLFLVCEFQAQQIELIQIPMDTGISVRNRYVGAGDLLVEIDTYNGNAQDLKVFCRNLKARTVDTTVLSISTIPGSAYAREGNNHIVYADTLYSSLYYFDVTDFGQITTQYSIDVLRVTPTCEMDTFSIQKRIYGDTLIQNTYFASYFSESGILFKSIDLYGSNLDSADAFDYDYFDFKTNSSWTIPDTDVPYFYNDCIALGDSIFLVDESAGVAIISPGLYEVKEFPLVVTPSRFEDYGSTNSQIIAYEDHIYFSGGLSISSRDSFFRSVFPFLEKRTLGLDYVDRVLLFQDTLLGHTGYDAGLWASVTRDDFGNFTLTGFSAELQKLFVARVDKDLNVLFEYQFEMDTFLEVYMLLPSEDPDEFYLVCNQPRFINNQLLYVPRIYHLTDLLAGVSPTQNPGAMPPVPQLTVYPNPVSESTLYIEASLINDNSNKQIEDLHYLIWSADGKAIDAGPLDLGHQVDVSNLAAGQYLLEVRDKSHKRVGIARFLRQ